MRLEQNKYLVPEWPAPTNIKAYCATRLLKADHSTVDDCLIADLNLSSRPCWLKQVHGNRVVAAEAQAAETKVADASYSFTPGSVCLVQTADCLPILLTDRNGSRVAAVHAGWRGLHAGIIEQAVKRLGNDSGSLMAWIGPAICQKHYEVGEELYQAFSTLDPSYQNAFLPGQNSAKYWLDLYFIARLQLQSQGIESIYGGNYCSYENAEYFHSYRRDGSKAGRLLSFIYIEK